MGSSGHRRNLLDPDHRKVSIGLAWDEYNLRFFQHFEGAYVVYESLPTIEDGWLTIEGTATNGAVVGRTEDLGIRVYYDPPPKPLTRGQVADTYDYGFGIPVASLRRPRSVGWRWPTHSYTTQHSPPSVDPYDVPSDKAPPVYVPFMPRVMPWVEHPPRAIVVPGSRHPGGTRLGMSSSLSRTLHPFSRSTAPGCTRSWFGLPSAAHAPRSRSIPSSTKSSHPGSMTSSPPTGLCPARSFYHLAQEAPASSTSLVTHPCGPGPAYGVIAVPGIPIVGMMICLMVPSLGNKRTTSIGPRDNSCL